MGEWGGVERCSIPSQVDRQRAEEGGVPPRPQEAHARCNERFNDSMIGLLSARCRVKVCQNVEMCRELFVI